MNNFRLSKIEKVLKLPKGARLETLIAFTYSLSGHFLFNGLLPFLSNDSPADWVEDESHYLKIFINSGNLSSEMPTELLGNVAQVFAGASASFHPKIYFLKYNLSNGEKHCRIVMGSFNATPDGFNKNIEFYVALESTSSGKESKFSLEQKKHLKDYCLAVFRGSRAINSDERKILIEKLDSIIAGVTWPEGGEFVYSTPGGKKKLLSPVGKERILVSPFWDASAITHLAKSAQGVSLYYNGLSDESDAPFDPQALPQPTRFKFHTVRRDKKGRQHLHGKLFYFGDSVAGNAYIGSANCTSRAIKRGNNFEAGILLPVDRQQLDAWLEKTFTKLKSAPAREFIDELAKRDESLDQVFAQLVAGFKNAPGSPVVVHALRKQIVREHTIIIDGQRMKRTPFYLDASPIPALVASVTVTIDEQAFHLPISGVFDEKSMMVKPLSYLDWLHFKTHLASMRCSTPEDIMDLYAGELALDDIPSLPGDFQFADSWRERKFPFKKMMRMLWAGLASSVVDFALLRKAVSFLGSITAADELGSIRRKIYFRDFDPYEDGALYRQAFYRYWARYIQFVIPEVRKAGHKEQLVKVNVIQANLKKLAHEQV